MKESMIGNDWINPMHTNVPGTDGQLSYGGYCFPKDTKALASLAEEKNVPMHSLNGAIKTNSKQKKRAICLLLVWYV